MFSGWSSGSTRDAHDLPFLAPRSIVRSTSRSRARGPSSRSSTPDSRRRSLIARCRPKRLRAISIGGVPPATAAARSAVAHPRDPRPLGLQRPVLGAEVRAEHVQVLAPEVARLGVLGAPGVIGRRKATAGPPPSPGVTSSPRCPRTAIDSSITPSSSTVTKVWSKRAMPPGTTARSEASLGCRSRSTVSTVSSTSSISSFSHAADRPRGLRRDRDRRPARLPPARAAGGRPRARRAGAGPRGLAGRAGAARSTSRSWSPRRSRSTTARPTRASPSPPRCIKPTFGLAGTPEILDAVKATGRRTAVLVGFETDICVYQSAVGLLDERPAA